MRYNISAKNSPELRKVNATIKHLFRIPSNTAMQKPSNLTSLELARKCLDRANSCDDELKTTRGLKSVMKVIFQALKSDLTGARFVTKTIFDYPAPHEGTTHVPSAGIRTPWPFLFSRNSPSAIEHGPLTLVAYSSQHFQGRTDPEFLIAELIAAYVIAPKDKRAKKDQPSYAFFIAGLAALNAQNDLDDDFRLISQAAGKEAAELATAAILPRDSKPLDDMRKGIDAVINRSYQENQLSKGVIAVLLAHRNLGNDNVSKPTKREVRIAALELLRQQGNSSEVYRDDALWTKIFNAAGLNHLKQGRPGRQCLQKKSK